MPYNVIFDPSMNIENAPGNTPGNTPGNESRNNIIIFTLIFFFCVILGLAFLFSSKRRH